MAAGSTDPLLLGVDCGLTVTKAVIFNREGRALSRGEARPSQSTPRPRWVERDPDDAWQGAAAAIRIAVEIADIDPAQIAAIGLCAYGDSLFLIDADGSPTRPAILSLDSRAHAIIERWRESGLLDAALPLTGQRPFASTLPALLTWLWEEESTTLAKTRWALGCKDWIRFCLTGVIGTDRTEASSGFADVQTQTYSDEAFELFGLADLRSIIPPADDPLQIVGHVTEDAAQITGLRAGTPVAPGLHDVMASAIGAGSVSVGQLTIVAGTWSINEVIAGAPVTDPDWSCRSFVEPGTWLSASWSPASATNLEWFVRELCTAEAKASEQADRSPYAFVDREVERVWDGASPVIFHPFLYGSPFGDAPSASFFGLRGWHGRAHLLRAVLEGVTLNHRTHVDALRRAFPVHEARLTGGATRSERWSQLFADALDLPVVVTDTSESGARGAALCAGVATGIYSSLAEAAGTATRPLRRHEPDPQRRSMLEETYGRYTALIDALAPVWPLR